MPVLRSPQNNRGESPKEQCNDNRYSNGEGREMTNDERLRKLGIVITSVRICTECGRNFILTREEDAQEYAAGHDCEEVTK